MTGVQTCALPIWEGVPGLFAGCCASGFGVAEGCGEGVPGLPAGCLSGSGFAEGACGAESGFPEGSRDGSAVSPAGAGELSLAYSLRLMESLRRNLDNPVAITTTAARITTILSILFLSMIGFLSAGTFYLIRIPQERAFVNSRFPGILFQEKEQKGKQKRQA